MKTTREIVGLAALVLATGCSSSSSGTNCGTFTACGGDVTGSWKLGRDCVGSSVDPFAGGTCSQATFQASQSESGTVTFQAGVYSTSNLDTTVVEDITVPSSCLMGATCAMVESNFNNQSNDAGMTTVGTCADTSGGCACHATVTDSTGPVNGTYSVSGTTLTLDGTAAPYCVQGNTLLIQTQSGMMGTAGSGTITLTATKQ